MFVRGQTVMSDKLKRLAQQFPRRTAQAAEAEFEIEKKESQRRTPVDTGDLKKSHRVEKAKIYAGKIRCNILVEELYAVYVHENLDAYHDNGQAKFLESTLLESAPYMAKRIAKHIELTRSNWGSI